MSGFPARLAQRVLVGFKLRNSRTGSPSAIEMQDIIQANYFIHPYAVSLFQTSLVHWSGRIS